MTKIQVDEEKNGIEVNADEAEPQYSYVVHGAFASCNCGSRQSRLIVPKCHGTYIHDMPVLTVEDCNPIKNIQGFGYCFSEHNTEREQKIREIHEEVNKPLNFFDKVVSFFGKKEEEAISDDLKENVLVTCKPVFASGSQWEPSDGEIRLNLKGKKALHVGCEIPCLQGGMIYILEDGQENAASEQGEAFEAKDWKEGDPLPNPTRKNIQALEEDIKSISDRMENGCEEGTPEYEALKAEKESKEKLRDTMKETADILDDIRVRKALETPCEDPAQMVKAMEESGQLKEMIAQGRFDTEEKKADLNTAKKEMLQEISESTKRYHELGDTKEAVLNQYYAGTPCVSISNENVQKKLETMTNKTIEAVNRSANTNSRGTKKDVAEAARECLNHNTSLSYPYPMEEPKSQNTGSGNNVAEKSPEDVAYIYYNGELMSANQIKKNIEDNILSEYVLSEQALLEQEGTLS